MLKSMQKVQERLMEAPWPGVVMWRLGQQSNNSSQTSPDPSTTAGLQQGEPGQDVKSPGFCLTRILSMISSLLDSNWKDWRIALAMDVINPALLYGKMEEVEVEVEVEGVRCCLLFTILLTLGLGLHPLSKLLPGYFLANLVFRSWLLLCQDMREASNTKGLIRKYIFLSFTVLERGGVGSYT